MRFKYLFVSFCLLVNSQADNLFQKAARTIGISNLIDLGGEARAKIGENEISVDGAVGVGETGIGAHAGADADVLGQKANVHANILDGRKIDLHNHEVYLDENNRQYILLKDSVGSQFVLYRKYLDDGRIYFATNNDNEYIQRGQVPKYGSYNQQPPIYTQNYNQHVDHYQQPAGYPQQPGGSNTYQHTGSYNPQSEGYNHPSIGYNQQPVGYNQYPEGYNHQPVGYNQQAVGYNQQPESYNQQPVGYNQQPIGYNQQNRGYNQQPGGYNQQPGGYNQQTAGYNQQPSSNDYNRQPVNYNQHQGSNYQKNNNLQPDRFNQQPGGYNQQMTGYNQQPGRFDQQSGIYNQQPGGLNQPHEQGNYEHKNSLKQPDSLNQKLGDNNLLPSDSKQPFESDKQQPFRGNNQQPQDYNHQSGQNNLEVERQPTVIDIRHESEPNLGDVHNLQHISGYKPNSNPDIKDNDDQFQDIESNFTSVKGNNSTRDSVNNNKKIYGEGGNQHSLSSSTARRDSNNKIDFEDIKKFDHIYSSNTNNDNNLPISDKI